MIKINTFIWFIIILSIFIANSLTYILVNDYIWREVVLKNSFTPYHAIFHTTVKPESISNFSSTTDYVENKYPYARILEVYQVFLKTPRTRLEVYTGNNVLINETDFRSRVVVLYYIEGLDDTYVFVSHIDPNVTRHLIEYGSSVVSLSYIRNKRITLLANITGDRLVIDNTSYIDILLYDISYYLRIHVTYITIEDLRAINYTYKYVYGSFIEYLDYYRYAQYDEKLWYLRGDPCIGVVTGDRDVFIHYLNVFSNGSRLIGNVDVFLVVRIDPVYYMRVYNRILEIHDEYSIDKVLSSVRSIYSSNGYKLSLSSTITNSIVEYRSEIDYWKYVLPMYVNGLLIMFLICYYIVQVMTRFTYFSSEYFDPEASVSPEKDFKKYVRKKLVLMIIVSLIISFIVLVIYYGYIYLIYGFYPIPNDNLLYLYVFSLIIISILTYHVPRRLFIEMSFDLHFANGRIVDRAVYPYRVFLWLFFFILSFFTYSFRELFFLLVLVLVLSFIVSYERFHGFLDSLFRRIFSKLYRGIPRFVLLILNSRVIVLLLIVLFIGGYVLGVMYNVYIDAENAFNDMFEEACCRGYVFAKVIDVGNLSLVNTYVDEIVENIPSSYGYMVIVSLDNKLIASINNTSIFIDEMHFIAEVKDYNYLHSSLGSIINTVYDVGDPVVLTYTSDSKELVSKDIDLRILLNDEWYEFDHAIEYETGLCSETFSLLGASIVYPFDFINLFNTDHQGNYTRWLFLNLNKYSDLLESIIMTHNRTEIVITVFIDKPLDNYEYFKRNGYQLINLNNILAYNKMNYLIKEYNYLVLFIPLIPVITITLTYTVKTLSITGKDKTLIKIYILLLVSLMTGYIISQIICIILR